MPNPTFSYVQGGASSNAVTAATSASITLSSTPNPGDIIYLGANFTGSPGTITVNDGNNNVFIAGTYSPAFGVLTGPYMWYLIVPSNPSATINFSWTNSVHYATFADEFSVTSGYQILYGHDSQNQATGSLQRVARCFQSRITVQ